MQILEDIEVELFTSNEKIIKLDKAINEFYKYISNNRSFIPNYQIRHYYGECISSAFVESTVNEVVSKRMRKKQQMRWTQKGAHLLLQVRTKTLNNELKKNLSKMVSWFSEKWGSREDSCLSRPRF